MRLNAALTAAKRQAENDAQAVIHAERFAAQAIADKELERQHDLLIAKHRAEVAALPERIDLRKREPAPLNKTYDAVLCYGVMLGHYSPDILRGMKGPARARGLTRLLQRIGLADRPPTPREAVIKARMLPDDQRAYIHHL